MDDFKKQLESLGDEQICLRLGEGAENYREGYYEILEEAARSRGLLADKSDFSEEAAEYKKNREYSQIVKLAYGAAGLCGIIGWLGIGLLSWALIELNSKQRDPAGEKTEKYPGQFKKHFLKIIIFAAVMTVTWTVLVTIFRFLM